MTKLDRQRRRDIASLAREYRHEAWEVVVSIMRNPDEKSNFRLQAAEIVIERAEGKAKQHVEVSTIGPVSSADLMAMALELREAESDPFLKGIIDAVPLLPSKSEQ